MPRFVKASRFEASVRELFGFHERPDALARLLPPWERNEVLLPPASLEAGTRVLIRTFLGPVPLVMEAEHVFHERDVEFRDRLVKGPFASWLHRHRFVADGDGAVLVDDVTYTLPLSPLSAPADALIVRPRLRRLFDFRHAETARAIGAPPPTPVDPERYAG